MKRLDAMEAIYTHLEQSIVVTIMGACAQELYDLGHCENFFYLQHAMGLASSIGLGLALNLPDEKIVGMDGDGSVLMNMGGLATLARYRPPNLVHIIFDNGSLLSTGGFTSHTTSGVTDLAALLAGIDEQGAVVAPSADGGTSALGGKGDAFFSYGPGSFHRHLGSSPTAAIVARPLAPPPSPQTLRRYG